jgi:TonB family protein
MPAEVFMRATLISSAAYVLLPLALGCGGADASSPAPQTPETSAVAPPPPAAPPPPSTNPDADAVQASRPALRACYDKARAANPALGRTTVTVSLRVDPAGHVSTVDLDYNHRFDDAAKQCMKDAAFAIKLPGGEPRRVTVPITFE